MNNKESVVDKDALDAIGRVLFLLWLIRRIKKFLIEL